MRKVILRLVLASVLAILAACEPIAPEPTATALPIDTPIPTVRPTRVPEIVPTAFFGRDVEPTRNTASIRLIHAASEQGALDVSIDGSPLVGSLGFGLASGVTTIVPGEYTVTATARGSAAVAVEATVTLTAGMITDVVIAPGPDGLQMVALNGPERAVDAGFSVARAVNALTDMSELSVELNSSSTGGPLAAGGATELLSFAEGDLSAEFKSNGTTLYSDTVRLRGLTNMVLVITGLAARPQLLVFESPTLSLYSLRVVNMSPEAREIDVFFDDALVASSLAYLGSTERAVYTTASALMHVYAANADVRVSAPYLDGQRITPGPGTTVTLAIYGPVSALRAMWIEEDNSPVPVGQSRVVFAHAMSGVQSLRVGVNSTDLEDIRAFGYGETSQPVLFDAGDTRVFLRDASRDGSIVEMREALRIEAGQSILYFVVGTDESAPPPTLTETVVIDEALNVQPLETPEGVFRVRYVNAIVSQPTIDVFQEGAKVVSGLRYTAASPLGELPSSALHVVASISDSIATLVDQRFSLNTPGDYTVYIYGTPENGINATVIADERSTTGDGVGSARLVNLTQDPFAVFGLAVVPISVANVGRSTAPTAIPTATAEGGSSVDIGRPRLPAGAGLPIRDVGPGKASRISAVASNALVYVVTSEQEIVASLPAVAFAPGTHTDIVVYEYRTATDVSAILFPLVYLPP